MQARRRTGNMLPSKKAPEIQTSTERMTNWNCWPQLFGWQANYMYVIHPDESMNYGAKVVAWHNQMYENPISYENGNRVTDEHFSFLVSHIQCSFAHLNVTLWLLFIHIEWWNVESWTLPSMVRCIFLVSSSH